MGIGVKHRNRLVVWALFENAHQQPGKRPPFAASLTFIKFKTNRSSLSGKLGGIISAVIGYHENIQEVPGISRR